MAARAPSLSSGECSIHQIGAWVSSRSVDRPPRPSAPPRAAVAKKTALRSWPVDRSYVANAPWPLPDGRVRIEWMHGGKLVYLSFLTFAGTRIADISTSPAAVPMKTVAPGS